jgi:hypothetical protein
MRDPLAKARLRIGTYWSGTLHHDKTFPPGARISIGSQADNHITVPAWTGLSSYLLIENGTLLHIADDMIVHVSIDLAGAAVTLAGNLGEGPFSAQRARIAGLVSPVRVVGERAAVWVDKSETERLRIWLQYLPDGLQ